jgi:hypothetical protein
MLANREINHAVVYDVPDHRVCEDRAMQGVPVSEPEGIASSEVIIEETITMEETFAESDAINGLIPAQDTSSNLAPEESIVENEAQKSLYWCGKLSLS